MKCLLLFQVLPASSHIPPPEEISSGEQVSTFLFDQSSPTLLEEQLARYLGTPLSFPPDRDVESSDLTISHISPQPEPGPLTPYRDFKSHRDSSLVEYFNPGTNLASREGDCASSPASNGQVSPPARKRKKAHMKDISNKSQKVSTTQAKESSKVFQSKFRKESSKPKVAKKKSPGNREETGSNTLLPSLDKSSSGVHIDEVTHESKTQDPGDIMSFVHSEEIPESSNVSNPKKKEAGTVTPANKRKKEYNEEVNRIIDIVQKRIDLDTFPTFKTITNKMKGTLEKWKNDPENNHSRPDKRVLAIENYITDITTVSTFLILRQISLQRGFQGQLITDRGTTTHIQKANSLAKVLMLGKPFVMLLQEMYLLIG
ncbi:hypothetical protein PCANC_19230 [Puccinia coronata f. sp. avenae]|uniref:Uncharacterized protein n=1 Tax=Puccinia coronata f. sp. avenae TaxID=200324 RepID=A0A2N5U9W2_9BASI|nr:hypothetical protein PCANC_19230 [Puccinia coronata f. sp. avenae]